MTIKQAIEILTKNVWFYEGSTKIDGRRCYIMRKYDHSDTSTQTVVYFTSRGLREEAWHIARKIFPSTWKKPRP